MAAAVNAIQETFSVANSYIKNIRLMKIVAPILNTVKL